MAGRNSSPTRPYSDDNPIIYACQPWLRRGPSKETVAPRLSKTQTDRRRRTHDGVDLSRYQGSVCPYCGFIMNGSTRDRWGMRFPTRDHVVPKCERGTAILIVCASCNNEKGSMPPDQFLERRSGCRRTLARLAMIKALREAL